MLKEQRVGFVVAPSLTIKQQQKIAGSMAEGSLVEQETTAKAGKAARAVSRRAARPRGADRRWSTR